MFTMEEKSAINSSKSEEPDGNTTATVLSDKLENEESPIEIRGMEDQIDEKPSSLELQLFQHTSTANDLTNIVSEWGKKVF